MSATRRPPDGALQLEWVFGYNGHTARNNVKINAKGHLVYYVAGVGVVHDHENQTQNFFTGHSDDITSLAMNSEKRIAATGQVGDDAYIAIWDAINCDPLSVIHDAHAHHVVALAFSNDSKQLASVGGPMSQLTLVVWDWQKGRRIARNIAHSEKVEEVEFDPEVSSRLVTCGKNHVKFWSLRGNVLQADTGIFGKAQNEHQTSISFLSTDKVVSGTAGGSLLVWAGGRVVDIIDNIHPGGITATESFRGGVITGGRDGTIRIYDDKLREIATMPDTFSLVYKTASPIQSLSTSENTIILGTQQNEIWALEWGDEDAISGEVIVQGHGVGEVWGLATHPAESIAVTGSDDGTIRLWSLRDFRQITSCLVGEPVRSVAFHPSGNQIAAGLLEGDFIIYQTPNLLETKRVSDRKEARHDVRFSNDGEYLAVASNDNFVDIYSVNRNYEKLREFKSASSFITHLDWATDSQHLQTNSGAGERLIYNIQGEGNSIVSSLPEDTEWASWTCVLGKDVEGLWAKYSDLSDVNAVDANFYYNIIVSGDDFGLVKLFRFPCPKRGSKPRASVGHSAHVTNVRWTSDSAQVISLGGADHAVFVWKFKPSRAMTSAIDTVSGRQIDEESGDDVVDTEDELEAIPEITGDLEEEFTNSKSGTARRRRRRRTLSSGRPKSSVELRDDSTFAKRLLAEDDKIDINEPPMHYLKIQHVFGYRSYDCRDNCHWLKDDKVVHHVAAVAVINDLVLGTQKHYLLHTDDILCLAVHPDGELVATGQIGHEPSIHVWSSQSLKILSFLRGGHERGVSSIAFSSDGERLASIGMDDYHTIVVWKWLTGRKIASIRNSTKKVFGVRFSPTNNCQLVSYGVRHVRVWTVVGSGMTWRQVKMGQKHKTDTVLCCACVTGAVGDRWALGMASGQVVIISHVGVEKSVKAHKGAIYSIFVPPEEENASSAWTGGRDGLLCEWDSSFTRCIKSVPIADHSLAADNAVSLMASQSGLRSLSWHPNSQYPLVIGTQNSEILLIDGDGQISILTQGHCKGEVWGLATHPRLLEAVSVSDDRTLRRWSLNDDFKPIGLTNLRKPARCVHFHPKGMELAIGFLDGSVSLLAYPSMERIGGAHHRQEKIADVKFSPDGRMLAVASHDSFVDLYVVDTDGDIVSKDSTGLKRLGVCRDASSFISHITWHKDSRLLQINSGAGEQLYYEAPKGTRLLIPEQSEGALAWVSPLTCPLDTTLSGIWQKENDLTDINSVATANDLPLVATASDEGGLLKIFRYPCQGKLKRHRKYAAHSSHVTKVWWTYDDSYLVTAGGADTSIIVWELKKVSEEENENDVVEKDDQDLTVDLPDEDVTVIDLEVSGLTEISPLRPVIDSKRRQFGNNIVSTEKLNSDQILLALQKMRAMPTVREDNKTTTVFVLFEGTVRYFDIEDGKVLRDGIRYEYTTKATAMAISGGTFPAVATAFTSIRDTGTFHEEDRFVPVEQGSLVHVWHPKDGVVITTLTTENNTHIITSLSFSPDGRFLAVLADASVIYIFNWIKGKMVSDARLRTGGVIAISYSTDTTVAALTPKALYLCDMVGNALLPTRTLIPPGVLSDPNIVFTSLAVNGIGGVYVGCSDASVIEWSLRVAIRRGHRPERPGSVGIHPTLSGIRSNVATNNEDTYVVFRYDSDLVIINYKTEDLSFVAEHSTAISDDVWRPLTVSLGKTVLVIGDDQKGGFYVFDFKKKQFTFNANKLRDQ